MFIGEYYETGKVNIGYVIEALRMICTLDKSLIDDKIIEYASLTLDHIEYNIKNKRPIATKSDKEYLKKDINDLFRKLSWLSGTIYLIRLEHKKKITNLLVNNPELIKVPNWLESLPESKYSSELYFISENITEVFSWGFGSNKYFKDFYNAFSIKLTGWEKISRIFREKFSI